MKLVTAEQMRAMDQWAIDQFKIPGLVLMENAGRGAAEAILVTYPEACEFGVVILCGPGNNGGDGFVIARHLVNQGYEVECFLLGARGKLKGDARTNYRIAAAMGIPITDVKTPRQVLDAAMIIGEAGLVVDAMFGTGLSRAIEGVAVDLIDLINEIEAPVVAVDIPSGLDADTGKPTGPVVQADLTCTFGLAKIGQFLLPGADYCGEVEVIDISFPPQVPAQFDVPVSLLEENDVLPHFGRRDPEGHKGTYGHVLVLGGSRMMSGAPLLAARAAVKSGAGLVTIGAPDTVVDALIPAVHEALKVGLQDDGQGRFSDNAMARALELADERSVVALGPGLGQSEQLETLLAGFLREVTVPLVVDADGLNNLSKRPEVFADARVPLVITPHPGEAARLLGITADRVQADRLEAARRLAEKFNAVTVLKGARSLIAVPDGRVWINPTGNPGMASGGVGDVLTGLIAALIAQGLPALDAALVGVFVHGQAGDLAREAVGERALDATALTNLLPVAIRNLEDGLSRYIDEEPE